MNKKQIKEYYNTNFNECKERIVDIDIYDDYETIATIITISRNHIIWKNTFKIEEDILKFIDSKCFT